jgi:hypothetical protein
MGPLGVRALSEETMPPPRFFRLQVADLTGSGRFNLRLWNETDQLLAAQVVQIPETGPTQIRWRGLLALDEYLEVEHGRGRTVDALMIELGEFLTQQVLGEPLTAHLFQRQRSAPCSWSSRLSATRKRWS